jgi:putative membrane protein
MYGYSYNNMMDGWNSGYSQGNSIVSLIFMSIMMILFIVLIVWAVRFFSRTTRVDGTKDDALELLKRRYAAGEIEKKQFEQMKKDLNDK